ARQSWRDPAGANPAQVGPSKPPGSECCVSGGDAEHEAYTAGAWGVGVSHEMMNSRERRLSSWSNATCAMPLLRGIVVPPGSRATSRAQGSRRKLGYLVTGRPVSSARDGPHREGEEP